MLVLGRCLQHRLERATLVAEHVLEAVDAPQTPATRAQSEAEPPSVVAKAVEHDHEHEEGEHNAPAEGDRFGHLARVHSRDRPGPRVAGKGRRSKARQRARIVRS